MESFTIELDSIASTQLFPDKTLSSFTNFLTEELNLEGQWEVANSETSYPSKYQNVTGKEYVSYQKLSKSSDSYYLEPGLYPSVTDIVEALNTPIQERHNNSKNCSTKKVSRITQKTEIYLSNDGSGVAFFSTDLGRILGSNIGNEFGVMLRGKGTNQNLLTTLSAYTLSWYIRTWVSTISLVTRAPHGCFAFFKFQSSKLETL